MPPFRLVFVCAIIALLSASCSKHTTAPDSSAVNSEYTPLYGAVTVNHNTIDLTLIPANAIDSARAKLRIAYGHTSHGSQLITGMDGLVSFKGDAYRFSATGANGALILHDTPFSGASD